MTTFDKPWYDFFMAKFKYQRPRRKYRTQTRSQPTLKPTTKRNPFDDALHVAIKACGIRTPKIGSTVSTHAKYASRLGRHEYNKDLTLSITTNANATTYGDRTHDRLIDRISTYLNN